MGYTLLLKRRTSQNIVWGGVAGCMQVLIGWTAVRDSLDWAPFVLFGVIFLWTPPHYWPLSVRYREDYANAGVPMLPVVAKPTTVSRQIVLYTSRWCCARCCWCPSGGPGWSTPSPRWSWGRGSWGRRSGCTAGRPASRRRPAGATPGRWSS